MTQFVLSFAVMLAAVYFAGRWATAKQRRLNDSGARSNDPSNHEA